MNEKDKIIERIKKLIALSEDTSTTSHERDACRKKAHSLMARFSIDNLRDEKDPEIIHVEFALPKPVFGLDTVKLCQILGIIGPPLGCYSYFKRGEDKVYLMGFKINCAIAEYTGHVLINQGKRECSSLYKQLPMANTKLAFWKGFVEGLRLRYAPAENSDEQGLVVYDSVKELFERSVKKVPIFSSGSNLDAMAKGAQSALDARINAGLQGSGTTEQRKIG